MKFILIYPLIFFLVFTLNACDSTSNLENNTGKTKTLLHGKTMGTSYNIVIAHPEEITINNKKLQRDINDLLENLNQRVSTYIPNSQISQFNQTNNAEWVEIDKDFFTIVEAAQMMSKLSDGAFDISISPLIDLWGFGVENHDSPPTKIQIQKALSHIGYQQLKLDSQNQLLSKTDPNLRIDLSAIAKGYAVDKISQILKANGFANHLVEIGGELRANGLNLSDKKWRIAVELPDLTIDIAQNGLEITNRSVATSGDYRNYFIKNGARLSHIIDPNTGSPVKHKLASVTVIHESTMLADAYATTILVLGEKLGKVFAKDNNLDVLMIIRHSDKFEFWSSSDLFRK